MYITGQLFDFESRLHQLPQSGADLNSFIIEGKSLTGNYFTGQNIYPTGMSSMLYKWNREIALKAFQFSGDNQYFLTGAIR
jgi:hypothetical protein